MDENQEAEEEEWGRVAPNRLTPPGHVGSQKGEESLEVVPFLRVLILFLHTPWHASLTKLHRCPQNFVRLHDLVARTSVRATKSL